MVLSMVFLFDRILKNLSVVSFRAIVYNDIRLKSYSDTNMKTISILLIRIFDEHLTPFSYEQFLKLTGGHYHIRDSRDLMHEVCNSTNSTPDEQVKKSGSAGTVPRV